MIPSQHTKHIAGRYLHALAVAKGDHVGALSYALGRGDWVDREKVVAECKAAITAMGSNDFPVSTPAAESFLPLMRPHSIPLQLANSMRAVPMRTRLYVALAGAGGAEVDEGKAIPVSKGNYTASDLKPRNFPAMIIRTKELANSASPVATQGMAQDLAQAVAEVESNKFVSPTQLGSVFFGQATFASTGDTVAAIDADLKQLVDLVPVAIPADAFFLMTKATATSLSLKRNGGAAAYPSIGPLGGTLLGLPVLITPAMEQAGTKYIGLVAPSQIFWADEGVVQLSASTVAAIEQTDAPSGDALGPTATEVVSMFQTESIALRAVRQSSWYVKAGAAAYFSVNY